MPSVGYLAQIIQIVEDNLFPPMVSVVQAHHSSSQERCVSQDEELGIGKYGNENRLQIIVVCY